MPTTTTSPVWTPEHEEFLRENAGKLAARDIAIQLGRTENAVRMKASNSGLSLTLSDRTRLPSTGRQGGGGRATVGGGSTWSSEEEAILRSMARKSPPSEIANALNRSEKDITRTAARMSIALVNQGGPAAGTQKRKGRGAAEEQTSAVRSTLARKDADGGRVSWDASDEEELRKYAGVVPVEEISTRMNRTVKAIQRKAAKMGVSLATERARRESKREAAAASAPATAASVIAASEKRRPGRHSTRTGGAAKRPGRTRTRPQAAAPVTPAAPAATRPAHSPARPAEPHASVAAVAPHPVSVMKFMRLLDEERKRLGIESTHSEEHNWDVANRAFTQALTR